MGTEWLAVCGVLLLAAGTAMMLRRRGGTGQARRLVLVERLPLTSRHSVCLVRLGDRGILIGVSPGGCVLLDQAEWRHLEGAAPEVRQ